MYHSRHHTLRSMYYSRRHLYNDLDILHRFHLTRTFHSCRLKQKQQDFLYFLRHFCQSIRLINRFMEVTSVQTRLTYIIRLKKWNYLISGRSFPISSTKNLIFCLFYLFQASSWYVQANVSKSYTCTYTIYYYTVWFQKKKTKLITGICVLQIENCD